MSILLPLFVLTLFSCDAENRAKIAKKTGEASAYVSELKLLRFFRSTNISILASETSYELSSLLVSEYKKDYNIKDKEISVEIHNVASYPFIEKPDIIVSPFNLDLYENLNNNNNKDATLSHKYAKFMIASDSYVFIQSPKAKYKLENILREQTLLMWTSITRIEAWDAFDSSFSPSSITYVSSDKKSDFMLSFEDSMNAMTIESSLDAHIDYTFALFYDRHLDTHKDIFTDVVQNTSSIGLVSLGNLQRELYLKSFSIDLLPHLISVEGESPVQQSNKTQLRLPLGKTNNNYSLQFPVYVYLSQSAFEDKKIMNFVKFLFSKKINHALEATGYLPLSHQQEQKSISDLTTTMQIYLGKDPWLDL